MVESTRLRVIKSKNLDLVLSTIDQLSFKIEIKQIMFDKKWHVFFILPESDLPALAKLEYVLDLD